MTPRDEIERLCAEAEARVEREIREAFAKTSLRWCVVQECPMSAEQAMVLHDFMYRREFMALRSDFFCNSLDATDSEIVMLRLALGDGFLFWQRDGAKF